MYVTTRNTNKRHSATIVEALDYIMRLPRVNRRGRTLVSEADILDVLGKLNKAGIGKPIDPETQQKLQDYRDNGMWNPEDDEKWNLGAGKYPKKNPDESQDDQLQDEQPADDQVKISVDIVTKLQDAADENGQIDLLDALRIIAGETE